jgi:tRNA pseudouridine38-40 synthase
MEKKKSLRLKAKATAKRRQTPRKTPRAPQAVEKTFRLVVAYRGTDYQGWQKQASERQAATVQEALEEAARKVLRGKVRIHGSGRTDSGVHARAQVAHLKAAVDLPTPVLLKALNAHLPEDIRILRLLEEKESSHAQLHAKAKTYRYFILNSLEKDAPVHWPFLRPYSWFVTYPLDLEAMQRALDHLRGTHDFKSFQNRGTPVEDTVREILEARLLAHDPRAEDFPWLPAAGHGFRLLEIRVRGTGFLKQMVRTIVGTIVEVGRGKLAAEDVEAILKQKSRAASGITAPAYGLFLDNVEY